MSVIIVGGGMAGVTLALALSHLTDGQLSIDLVEAKSPDDQQHPGFDSRCIVLAQGTCQQLTKIGAWSALKECSEAIKSIHVSDRGHFGLVHLSADNYQLPALGQVIELHDAGKKMFALLQHRPNVRIHCPAMMVGIERSEQQVKVKLDNGDILSAQLAVAADGSHSMLAETANISWQNINYQQVAVIANIQVSNPIAGAAFERFTAHGPLALLPIGKDRYSLVWCHEINHQPELMSWSDERFIHQLQHEFGWRLGTIHKIGQRHYYPLTLRYAQQHISHRIALVSNAAQTLHPIAGQGFNLGLRDVMTLAETISEAVKIGDDLGSYRVLSQYQTDRQQDRLFTMSLTDGLIRLFANNNPLFAGARNLTMLAMNHSSFLQARLVGKTIGQFKR